MKKLAFLLTFGLLCGSALAGDDKLVLDKVRFSLTSKQWVKTSKAKLQIGINATLSNTDLVKARSDIMTNLNKIAKSEWHITQFVRSQDSSGLEKLYVEAQSRVPQQVLTNVNVQAKSVSKPGATYRVINVDFTPSLQEVQQAKKQVRAQLYQRINDEITALNKQYPQQKYSVFRVVFNDGNMPMPRKRRYKAAGEMNLAMAAAPAAISVSNQVQLTAFVAVASNRNEE